MALLSLPRVYAQRFYQLLSNPTSFYVALLVIIQLIVALSVSVCLPFLVRRCLLPSSIQHEIPLNLVFSPCNQDLHGVCSFPTANVDVEKYAIFSPSITYTVSVRLNFAPVDSNSKLGLFQNQISIFDGSEKRLRQWHKSAYIKEPSIFSKLMRVCFFPLYFIGAFEDYHILEISLTDDYLVESQSLPARLQYVLQDRFAQIDSATLLVNARFGLIRNLLYYWPVTTYVILFGLSVTGCLIVFLVYWGQRSYQMYSGTGTTEEQSQQRTPSKKRTLTGTAAGKAHSLLPSDEFIPTNLDELPECVEQLNIRNITPREDVLSDGIRKRR